MGLHTTPFSVIVVAHLKKKVMRTKDARNTKKYWTATRRPCFRHQLALRCYEGDDGHRDT